MSKMSVNLAGVTLKNPVMTASGTFGSGAEYSEFVDLNNLGAVVTKGVANVPWPGNPTPRVAETTGFTAGPDIPPVLFASANVLRLISIFIPVMVLIRETTSAPPASAALAISVISVTLGLSFIITGCLAYFFTSLVMASRALDSVQRQCRLPLRSGRIH